jgi:transposase
MRPDGPPVRAKNDRQRQRRLDSDDLVAFQDAYLEGIQITEIAQRFGIHRNTVFELVKRLGLPSRRQAYFSAEEISQVIALYKSGQSAQKVADQFSVNASTIRYLLLKNGVSMRDHHGCER